MNHVKTHTADKAPAGFALIASISIMVLLVMIALGMLSLSTVELRSSKRDDAKIEAQSNARMALMIALGELQKAAGPDQRVTANADILADSKQAHLLGVWKSFKQNNSGLIKGQTFCSDQLAKAVFRTRVVSWIYDLGEIQLTSLRS